MAFCFGENRQFLVGVNSALLTAQVPQIPFGHDIDKRRELAGTGIVAVDSVADGDEAYSEFSEKDFRIKTGLQIISANSAHVLRQNQSHFSGFDIGNQPLPCKTLKIASGPSVIGVVDAVSIPVVRGIAFEIFFLIDDRITVSSQVIV